MNAKISVFVICVKAIIYLLLYNLHDCTFKNAIYRFFIISLIIDQCFIRYQHRAEQRITCSGAIMYFDKVQYQMQFSVCVRYACPCVAKCISCLFIFNSSICFLIFMFHSFSSLIQIILFSFKNINFIYKSLIFIQ